jgi:hypothetical protein
MKLCIENWVFHYCLNVFRWCVTLGNRADDIYAEIGLRGRGRPTHSKPCSNWWCPTDVRRNAALVTGVGKKITCSSKPCSNWWCPTDVRRNAALVTGVGKKIMCRGRWTRRTPACGGTWGARYLCHQTSTCPRLTNFSYVIINMAFFVSSSGIWSIALGLLMQPWPWFSVSSWCWFRFSCVFLSSSHVCLFVAARLDMHLLAGVRKAASGCYQMHLITQTTMPQVMNFAHCNAFLQVYISVWAVFLS